MNTGRRYTMGARAESAAATRTRILQAATSAMRERFRPNIRLDDIAAAAGVSVQTVLRIFGSRRRLLDAVTDEAAADVAAGFAGVPIGDVDGFVRAYFDHYERVGDLIVRNISEDGDADLEVYLERGRSAHRAGIEKWLGPPLRNLSPQTRRQTVDALVANLDVYVWKLLRRDLKRSRPDAESTVRQTIHAILEAQS